MRIKLTGTEQWMQWDVDFEDVGLIVNQILKFCINALRTGQNVNIEMKYQNI